MKHILIMSLLVLAGCGLSLDTPPPVENHCSSDSDCTGAICAVELGMCVTPDTETLRIGLEVTPPDESMAATHSLGPYEVAGATDLGELPVPPSITVIGTVRVPGEEEPVGANIKFSRPGAFPGARRIEVETTTSVMPSFVEGIEADFQTELVPDQEYDITVTPVGEWATRLPPLRRTQMVGGGGDIATIAIDYPESLDELHGLVINSMELPAPGRNVWAVGAETGRRVSSTAVTSEDEGTLGQFTLQMAPGTESYLIRIGTGEDTTNPTIFADPAYLVADDEGVVRILVPMIRPVCYIGTVELGDTREVAEGATVTFKTDEVLDPETGLSGTFEAILTAQADGTFAASLLPGSYDVLVTPPAEDGVSRYGVLHESAFQINVDGMERECIQGQLFQLPERAAVGGVVRTGDSRLMRDASVTAVALGRPLEELPAARYNSTGQTTTDPMGLFNLPLDIGVYDLFIKPPPESNFPWVVKPSFVVGSGAPSYSDTYEVTAPIPVTGTLSAHPGAEIRAFAMITEADGTERNVAVGRTVVAEDGTFTLLLPARL
jgi:hypothetical protein